MIEVSLLSLSFRNLMHRARELSAMSQSEEQSVCGVFHEGDEEVSQKDAIESREAALSALAALSDEDVLRLQADLLQQAKRGVLPLEALFDRLDKIHSHKYTGRRMQFFKIFADVPEHEQRWILKADKIADAEAAIEAFSKVRSWNVYTLLAIEPPSFFCEVKGIMIVAATLVTLLAQIVVPILMAAEGRGESGWCPDKGKASVKITGMVMMSVCCASLLTGLSDVVDFVQLAIKLQISGSPVSRRWPFHIGSRLNTLGHMTCVLLTPGLLFLLYTSADELSLADVVLNALALNFVVEVDNLLLFQGMYEAPTKQFLAALEDDVNSIKRQPSEQFEVPHSFCFFRITVPCVLGIVETLFVNCVGNSVIGLYMAVVIIATPICL